MTDTSIRQLTLSGLWKNNPATVQLLGLCPLLAVSNSLTNAIGLGITTILVLCAANLSVALSKQWARKEIRVPIFVMLIASFVTSLELWMSAYHYELYRTLGLFIPLIVTNCIILGRAEGFASRNLPLAAFIDGLMQGLGFTLVLMVLGFLRELLGQGTLFSQVELIFGDIALNWQITLIDSHQGLLIALLPPGAFILMGFLIAAKKALTTDK